MFGYGLLMSILIGILAGALAGRITGNSHGLVLNLIVGLIGSMVGPALLNLMGMGITTGGLLASIAVSTLGAAVFLGVLGLLKR